MEDEVKYPECEKLAAVKDKSQKIGEFMEWLQEKGVELAVRHTHTKVCLEECDHEHFEEKPHRYDDEDFLCGYRDNELASYHAGCENLLAEFFEIDLNKVEEERRAMLEEMRNA